MFLDNAGSHPREVNLKNVKIIFLPPNSTSVCQPLDQGIINNFKFYYRDLVLKHILAKMGGVKSASELSKTIDVLEALYFIKAAWSRVTATTIQNCFGKAGFKKNDARLTEFDPEDDLPLSMFSEILKGVKELELTEEQSLEDFITIDRNVQTEDNNIDIQSMDVEDKSDAEQDNDCDLVETQDIVEDSGMINSYDEALKLVGTLKYFSRDDFVAFQHIKNLESHFQNCLLQQKRKRLRQSSILNFINTD